MAGKVPVLSSVELSQQIHEKRDQPGFLRAVRMLMAKSVIEGTAKQGPEENSPHFRILDAAAFGEYKQRSREVFRQKAQVESSARILKRKHPLIVGNGWAKKNVSEIRAREKEIEALDRWLWSCRKTAELCTVPERCFEIWGNEHALRDDRQLQAIVRGCGISNGDLKMFSSEAREFKHCALSFPLSAPRLLVSENFSGYYALHRLVMRGEVPAKSIPANVLVFGGGTPVSAKGALGAFVKECLYADQYSGLYWGDVDGPGLEIQYQTSVDTRGNVQPWFEMYEEMAKVLRTKRIPLADLPDCEKMCSPEAARFFLERLSFSARETFEKTLQANKRVPQELMGIGDVRRFLAR